MSDAPEAVRHPKRGKAHRYVGDINRGVYTEHEMAACGKWAHDMTERLPIDKVDAYDRCLPCWAGTEWPARRD